MADLTTDDISDEDYLRSVMGDVAYDLQLYNSWVRVVRAYENLIKQLLKVPEGVDVVAQTGAADEALRKARVEVNKLAYKARKAKAQPPQ